MARVRFRTVGYKPPVGDGAHRIRFCRESMYAIPLLKTNLDAIVPKFVLDKPYRILTNQTRTKM